MGNATARAALAIVLIGLADGGLAAAQVEEVEESAASPEYGSKIPIDEHTAFTVPRHAVKIGVLTMDFGVAEGLSIGIDPAPYLARAFGDLFVPNLHLKGVLLQNHIGTISGQIAGYYGFIRDGPSARWAGAHRSRSAVRSGQLSSRVWLHLEVNYNHAHAVSSDLGGKAEFEGSVATRNWQGGAMLEYRLSPVVGLLARGRVQAFSSPLVIRGEGQLDPYTTADFAAEYTPIHEHPWVAVGALAMTWQHVGSDRRRWLRAIFHPRGQRPRRVPGIRTGGIPVGAVLGTGMGKLLRVAGVVLLAVAACGPGSGGASRPRPSAWNRRWPSTTTPPGPYRWTRRR